MTETDNGHDAQKVVLVLNGPNLNLLGQREPAIYGDQTLDDIAAALREHGRAKGVHIDFKQSNHEGALVDWIHQARSSACAIIINAGALTHTSVALRDALKAVALPFYEIHISNVYAREPFRHHSYLGDIAVAVISGLGLYGYLAALDHIVAARTNEQTDKGGAARA